MGHAAGVDYLRSFVLMKHALDDDKPPPPPPSKDARVIFRHPDVRLLAERVYLHGHRCAELATVVCLTGHQSAYELKLTGCALHRG